METVIIITEIKLTTVNDNIHELYIHELYGPLMCHRRRKHFTSQQAAAHGSRQHLKNRAFSIRAFSIRAFSIRAFSHIGRFRLTPKVLCDHFLSCCYIDHPPPPPPPPPPRPHRPYPQPPGHPKSMTNPTWAVQYLVLTMLGRHICYFISSRQAMPAPLNPPIMFTSISKVLHKVPPHKTARRSNFEFINDLYRPFF